MSHAARSLLLAAVIVPALGTLAAAQPGACEECAAYGPPAPIVAAAPAPEVDPSNRIGVGLHLASLAIANREDPDADPTQLAGGGLQIRYKLTPRWELELAMAALRQTDADGEPTGPTLHTGSLGVLIHMRPGRRWDWYLAGAVGGIARAEEDGDGDRAHQGRAMAQLGIGVEHRWGRLGIGLDVRVVGIAPAEPGEPDPVGGVIGKSTPDDGTDAREDGDAGAQAAIAATYYF